MPRLMAAAPGWFETRIEGDRLILSAGGRWVIGTLAGIDAELRRLAPGGARRASIDIAAVERLDTAGAWVLCRTRRQLRARGVEAEFAGVGPAHGAILDRIGPDGPSPVPDEGRPSPVVVILARLGAAVIGACRESVHFLGFLGETTHAFLRAAIRPGRIRFTALVYHVERAGLDALPIVGLLSFLIGVVLAFQGAGQLSRFGAEIYTVNLLGLSVLREMGVLLTAIIVAGRSGSAFGAEIGAMRVNEEIDAMRALGLDPVEVLVLPRVLALVLVLPLLTVFADAMGLVGGMVMSAAVLDVSPIQFFERLKSVVPAWTFWIGLIKAPVFGFLIALVGCREGLVAAGSAESVGRHTTRSVVVSLFLVIVADAAFSVFFSVVGV